MLYRWAPGALAALKAAEPYEVTQVLSAGRRLPVPGTAGGVPVVAVFGRTITGRLLMVLVHLDAAFDQQIVGAREPTAEELAMFERWEREG